MEGVESIRMQTKSIQKNNEEFKLLCFLPAF